MNWKTKDYTDLIKYESWGGGVGAKNIGIIIIIEQTVVMALFSIILYKKKQ